MKRNMPASGNSDGNDETVEVKKHEAPPGRRRHPTKIQIPRRAPSVVTPPRQVVYPSPDRTTCKSCPCYPKEEPYFMPKKLNPCLKSPLTLYELAAKVVDNLEFPEAFGWSVDDVAVWMSEDVGLPRYMECIRDNNINGRRLLLLEDGSHCPEINIHDFEHIKQISRKIHELFSTEFIKFSRSIGLPPRKPLTHCTWFKSRTGPTWGIRQNWSRSDILRWMKILMPEPIYMNHWDLVWYHKPDFPCVKFARVPKPPSQVFIPHYKPEKEICREYLAQRKFKILHHIPEDLQYIWMERRPGDMKPKPKKVKKKKFTIPIPSRLDPKKIDLEGLSGKDLILARRRLPKRKFLDI